MTEIELLAPAANADIAVQAILHGADAVYIGASSHGARKSAANSVDDIRRTVDFAHRYRARVYVTVNTIVYEREFKEVEKLVRELYRAGVDAIIVQDMALLRLDLPPISLHASTQCDTRTPAKAQFLERVGFSQIVLARELTLAEIGEICRSVSVHVECFVHGALCVSYSGRCHASQVACGRSANRGECAQICRLPYTLTDGEGRTVRRGSHLLSLKDFNASDRLDALIEAGVRSFKIEGRLKDAAYVKNVTAEYSRRLDAFIARHPGEYRRTSFGRSEITFTPALDRSFNRGFTHYFLDSPRPRNISQPATPKSMGEIIKDVSQLNNGDGISWFDSEGAYCGVMVNGVRDGKIIGARPFTLPKGAEIHRTYDRKFVAQLEKPTAQRKIELDVGIDETGVSGRDERGVEARVALDVVKDVARKPMEPRGVFEKLGDTVYRLRNFENLLDASTFIPASRLTEIRRRLTAALDTANLATYRFDKRRGEDLAAKYPEERLDYRDNVANPLAERFYREHGVREMEPALEVMPRKDAGTVVMTTRHCIRREMGACLKEGGAKRLPEPLTISSGNLRFSLDFDCARCEMLVKA
ncbi:MAG: DUF3656 domain-containing protein [Muribaculaceae bacterium]|nr:DUF3656 domain-containing protein [Muribaculaceae bacterium]